jgi:rhodanese-related sulfurtransferase
MKRNYFLPFLWLFIAGVISACANEPTNQQQAVQTQVIRRIGVEEFDTMLAKQDSVVLDVRTPREFNAGHIKAAINLDFHDSEFESNLSKLDKSKTYLVYCAGGARSSLACKKMNQIGFAKLIDLARGFSGWRQAKSR